MNPFDRFREMASKFARSLRLRWMVVPVLLLLAAGCYFDKEEKVENNLSFDRIADTLKQFDDVTIVLKNLNGDTLDVIFHGKVDQVGDVHNLKAPHWDGGRIIVSISGTKDGKTVYQLDARMDAASDTRDFSVVVTPFAALSSAQSSMTVLVGDSLPLPTITVSPANLLDKALEWSATTDGLLELGPGFLKAKQAGSGLLTVRLKSNPAITLSIPVTVSTSGMVPVSISLQPDSLEIAAGGAPQSFSASVAPQGASAAVLWSSSDTSIATVDATGKVQGKSRGLTRITATSQVRSSVTASAPVKVTAPIAVESIKFETDSLEINVNGAAANLVVSALPAGASNAVSFLLSDTTKATVQNGRITGIATGRISVIATSLTNPSAKDTLIVRINGPVAVETVAFAKDSLDILVGAAAESLIVSVLPAGANPAVTFSLSDTTKASIRNGKITGKAAGRITVTAASVSNPSAQDNLIVRITVPIPNDTTPPLKPTVTVKPAGPTQERRPVWSWKSGGGGAGAYQISLDKATFDTSALSLSDTTYTPAADLAAGLHVLYVRERDASGNWSDAGSAQVDIDIAAPTAPKVLGPSQTSSLPRWTWTTGGNGGAGIFRSRLGDANFPANAPESRDTIYALTAAVSGTTYTLYVEERDLAGNWSAAGSLAIKYDLTKPTVAITVPQASGTFITALDTVTLAGTATGPNRIAKVEYVLDAVAASPITLGAGGSWTLAALKVANAKTTTVKVTATDSLGNTGEAQLQILRDSDVPLPPTTLLKPSSPTNVAQSAWAWSAGGDGAAGSGLSGKYRWKLNAGAWTETNAASAPTVLLAEGANTFSVEEQDKAGNWSDALTGTVVLDTKVPDAVTFVGVDGSYTADDTPTWTWRPSATNGGIGKYLAKLDLDPEFDLDTATTYTPVTPLSDNATHTLTVREKDQVPGVAGTAKGFSYKVKVNPPAAPVVKSAVASLANNGLTNNPGFTWTSGGGGNGKYRVKVNTEATYRVNGVAQTTFSLAAGDPDGTYAIHVSEQDDLGRWGPDGNFTIQLDRTGPAYTQVQISGSGFDLRDGYITNLQSLTISYKADGISKQFDCILSKDDLSNVCSVQNTDALGNASTLVRNVVRRSKVVFFKQTAGGAKDGSSWENAMSDLTGYITGTDSGTISKKILWVASGDYSAQEFTIVSKSVTVLGGFDAASFPTDANNRSKTTTTLGHVLLYAVMGGTWDGIRFGGGLATAATVTFQDCQSPGPISIGEYSKVTMNNFELSGWNDASAPGLSVTYYANLIWNGGKIINNIVTDGYPLYVDAAGTLTLMGSLNVSGNVNKANSPKQLRNQGVLTITSPAAFSCETIYWDGGTGSCLGTTHP